MNVSDNVPGEEAPPIPCIPLAEGDFPMFSTRWRVCAIAAVSALLGGVPAAHAQPGILACGDRAFNAEAVLSGSTWTARNGGRTVYTGSDMRSAAQAAV